MPSLGGRNESRPVFLGGIIAALILRLAFAPYPYDFLAWFALVPLFFSLHRSRNRPWRRFFHGVTFSLLLVLWCNSWFFTALSLELAGDGSILESVRAGLGSALAWIAISLFSGLFAVAAGGLLRSRSVVARALGLPALWMGLEVLRGPMTPIPSPWLSGWLSLGYALRPGSAEAQLASLVGVHGLSFLIVLCSVLLLECVLSSRLRSQLVFALLAAAIPLTAYGYGRLTTSRPASVGATPVAIISHVDETPEAVLRFATSIASTAPEIILWSDVALSTEDLEGPGDARDRLHGFLARLSSVWEPDAESGSGNTSAPGDGPSGTVLLTDGGRLVAVYRSARDAGLDPGPLPLAEEDRLYFTPKGSFALGLDFEFLVSEGARVASATGAQLLVCSARTREQWGGRAHEQHINMVGFRAVENRRWLVSASSTGAYVIDPHGRPVLELLRGFDSAGVESVRFLSDRSFYTAYGWYAEPLSLLAAIAIIIWPAVLAVRRRRR